MSSWRAGRALLKLRAQVDEVAPNRNKEDDGTIGDASHQARTSDHNPWVGPDGGYWIVTAIDITHDPRHGVDTYVMADEIRKSNDKRLKYIISNRRIANAGAPWRPYHGANPHDHHMHISVRPEKRFYDDDKTGWMVHATVPDGPPARDKPTLRLGDQGPDVKYLQTCLGINADGYFGPLTRDDVIEFQKEHGFVADGVVGPQTWNAVLEGGPKV